MSVHTLRHSFAPHVLKVAAGGTASQLDALLASTAQHQPPVLREPQPAYA
ncbi:MAG: hypothetical protein KF740_08980 [Ramlibacter sp.]|nr:hypothetical protein [Ramlibacter sp.]